MQRDISNPRWVAVLDSRNGVRTTTRIAFAPATAPASDERNVLVNDALARHLAAVVGFIVAAGKDPDRSEYVMEIRRLLVQGAYPFPPLLPNLPSYEDLLPR